jgi:pyruvate kinase
MSFVRNKENIVELRDFLEKHNATHIKIISKIENQEAIENLEEIIKNSD